ncbi:MAG: PAS domain S-box protein [Polyangiaceae bacterium]|nr:PAS domain S-box protein [Polyangiaceae bacterium]
MMEERQDEGRVAEEALRISEAQHREIFRAVSDALLVLTPEGKVIEANPAACELLGYAREELLSLPQGTIAHPDSMLIRDECIAAVREGHRYAGEAKAIRKDGSTITVEFTGTAFPYGGAPHLLLVFRDTSERKALEARLFQAQKMESVGRLAGGVAHDFNNLLTAILCYGELCLQQIPRGSPIADHVQQMIEAATRGARLTGQLLAFARKSVIEPRVIDPNGLIGAAAEMLRRLIGEDIDLVCLPAPDLGRVKADPGQIEQILMNLAVNARDAMPRGGRLAIETANVSLDEAYAAGRADVVPGDYVMIAVTDSGAGIDPAQLPLIFEPFYTTKAAGKGTGLGLATCYGIVKQHRGHIAVYSEPGRGTTFKVYLPRATEGAAPEEVRPEPRPTAGDETLLVVEDYAPLRRMAREVLSALGYTVLTAADGEAALESARAHAGPIHLLITDVVMPRMGGKDLAEILGAERPGLRVLYSSGYTESTIAHQGVLSAGVPFIQKPYRLASLAEKVRTALDAPRAAG